MIQSMLIIFRADASFLIGSGHVMRCLTLADELRQRGADIRFCCREHSGHLIDLLEDKGYPVVRLPQANSAYLPNIDDVVHASWLGVPWKQDAADMITALGSSRPQWLIVDHYGLDFRWEQELRSYVGKIMVIDDLADRMHDCDLLLDQNLYLNMETRYDNLVQASCKKLLGPKYALLRPEFAQAFIDLRKRDGKVNRFLVFFGGVDPTNETLKALEALANITSLKFEVDVVVGAANPNRERIRAFCELHETFNYYYHIDNMAELIAAADLAIGAGGATTWERCYLGLPTICVAIADNQYETAKAVSSVGATMFLGKGSDVSVEDLVVTINYLLQNSSKIREMEKMSFLIMNSDKSQGNRILTDIIMGDIHVNA